MTAKEFVEKDLERIFGVDLSIHNEYYTGDQWIELMEEYHQAKLKLLGIANVVKSLPIQDLPNCTRVEVIDEKGRSYVNSKPTNKVRLSIQDDGRTAKIFID
jgi:hypothetical protein